MDKARAVAIWAAAVCGNGLVQAVATQHDRRRRGPSELDFISGRIATYFAIAAMLVHIAAWAVYYIRSRCMTNFTWFAFFSVILGIVVGRLGARILNVVSVACLAASAMAAFAYLKRARRRGRRPARDTLITGPSRFPEPMTSDELLLLAESLLMWGIGTLAKVSVPAILARAPDCDYWRDMMGILVRGYDH
ncbi:unnamed protein product (mitochondrion) [Plasmodiophora brassicae]|uniref:Uncharacterized protein n=1 Tax=Plasmodiophora brassicae TaxID=37360 RepID=A0A0G4IGX1_PLABS|nr:hypothetical protein PBRA_000214 [Plasmodiophora brassicae]SPQ96776.1 unnamed protein product [Plasmodiophora brassicae]